ncbi:hypothetical protein [Mycobacterium sp.]|uniref:hypothetical protein n=1 Tax=Mycobacterium sp. TaxID=1785 RepID=UPI003F945015
MQRTIRHWNNEQARFYGIHFSPTDWREAGTPEFGDYAQDVLNDQLVNDSDAGLAVFTDRLGTPTEEHESGTAEEIHRLRQQGKDVAVFVNNCPRAPLMGSAHDEKTRLNRYLDTLKQQAFIADYDTEHRLGEVVYRLLTRIAGKYRREAEASRVSSGASAPPGDLDEEPEDPSKGVWPRIEVGAERDWRLVLESNINQPLRNVTPRYEDEEGNPSRDFDLLASRHQPTAILPPRGTITYPLVQAMQSPPSAICVVEWTDPQGNQHETRASVRTY